MFAILRRNPQFRRLWAAQAISQGGDWLNRIAILTLIGRLGSPSEAAGVGALFGFELAVRLFPSALFGPIAGPLADRLPRRALMIGSDLLRIVVVLGYLLIDRPEELPLLYGLLITQMSLTIFFTAARSAAVPQTVPAGDLHAAYTISATTWSAMLALGAAAGGLLVELVGVRGVFLLDACTFAASAAMLLRLAPLPVPEHPQRLSLRDLLLFVDMRRAFAHLRERKILAPLFAKTLWGSAGGFLVLLSVAARERFPSSTDAVEAAGNAGLATGLLYTARGIGTGIGPILARHYLGSTDAALRRQILAGFAVGAGGYAVFAVCESLPWAFFWVLVAHCGGSTLWVASTTWWQRRVDNAFRGRVFSLEFLGMTLAFIAGALGAGWVYDRTGSVRDAVWVQSGLVVAGGLAWAWIARRTAAAGGDRDGADGYNESA
ncbi:MAG TPA: MFS transporter [Planctomycetota bacterium]